MRVNPTSIKGRLSLKLSRSDSKLDRYSIFVVLYATAFLLEMVEHWRYPGFTAAAICISILLVWKTNRVLFLFFLVVTTAYFIIFRFPEVANHVNLIIFCNVALIGGILHSLVKVEACATDDAFFGKFEPILRLMIIVTFSVAGFHKLNYDFINPEISCVYSLVISKYSLINMTFLGMPAFVPFALIALITSYLLWRQVPRPALPRLDVFAIRAPMVAIVAGALILLAVSETSTIQSPQHLFVFLVAVMVLCWQLVEGPLLFIRGFQWFALFFCLVVHAQLAMIGIADFQSVAIALLMPFVPLGVLEAWNHKANLTLLGVSVHRVHAYFLLNLIAGFLSGIDNHIHDIVSIKMAAGFLFNIGLLIMLWPIIADLFSHDRTWRWDGVSVLDRRTPKFLYVFPIALLLFGMTSHFGLRTAGNFSMFSNLRTEGESNHLLFSNNPLKFAGYQEDVVTVHEIDDEAAKIGHQYMPLKGNEIPVVEFKKLILNWREEHQVVPMVFEYDGKVYATDNIIEEPDWQVDGYDLEMKLMDFRVIQPQGPNRCSW